MPGSHNEVSETGHLVLLVGSNPMPCFLAASTLRPRRLTLVHSDGTEDVMRRLAECIAERLGSTDIRQRRILDPWSAESVTTVVSDCLDGSSHLDYTGGTKVMAAHAHRAFGSRGPGHASYVDEDNGVLRFDDGTTLRLAAGVDLALLCKLHGVETRTPRPPKVNDPTAAHTDALATCVLSDPGLAVHIYEDLTDSKNRENRDKKPQHLRDDPYPLADHCAGLQIREVPGDGWSNDTIEHWVKFLKGGWLETWTGSVIQGLLPDSTVHTNVKGTRANRQFEVDVAVVVGHRLHLVSCTTADDVRRCKLKGFEVTARTRQLGGDLARSALVCFLDGVDKNSGQRRVDLVQGDLEDLWDAPNTPRVFGLEELRAWEAGDTTTLRDWLRG